MEGGPEAPVGPVASHVGVRARVSGAGLRADCGFLLLLMAPAGPTLLPPAGRGWEQCGTMGPLSVLLRIQSCRGWVGVFLSPPMELMTF